MIRWSPSAQKDLERLYAFLLSADPGAAKRTLRALTAAVRKLTSFPRLGPRLSEFNKREVRRLIVGAYEIRYELRDDELWVLRVWHVREDR